MPGPTTCAICTVVLALTKSPIEAYTLAAGNSADTIRFCSTSCRDIWMKRNELKIGGGYAGATT